MSPHGSFDKPPLMRPVARDAWLLYAELIYYHGEGAFVIRVPPGWQTDLDSTPRRWLKAGAVLLAAAVPYLAAWVGLGWGIAVFALLLWAAWSFPTREQAAAGAVVHDYLYFRGWDRRAADRIAWHAWQATGAPRMGPVWATLFWAAVRLFGRRAWRQAKAMTRAQTAT